jgi:hypothetical protein
MIQRNINPKPRFVTLTASVPSTGAFVGAPLATLWKTASFKFIEDSIMHSMLINSTLVADGAASLATAAITYGNGSPSITFILGAGISNNTETVIWRDNLQNPAAGVLSDGKSTQFMLNEFFVHAGTEVTIYVNGLSGTLDVNATIAFNPIAEWVNFREPTSGTRV